LKYKSARYDIQVTNDYEQLDLDFILTKDDEKIVHGTVWDDSDDPKRIPGAVIVISVPGDNYYDSDPNDIKTIECIRADYNGEFAVGPFKAGMTVIFKIFDVGDNRDGLFGEIPEEFKYINEELEDAPNNKPDELE
jgi:hypothetical protein